MRARASSAAGRSPLKRPAAPSAVEELSAAEKRARDATKQLLFTVPRVGVGESRAEPGGRLGGEIVCGIRVRDPCV